MRPPPVTASLLVKVLWIQTVVLQCVLSVKAPIVREAGAYCDVEQVPIVRESRCLLKGRAGACCKREQLPIVRELVAYCCMGLHSL